MKSLIRIVEIYNVLNLGFLFIYKPIPQSWKTVWNTNKKQYAMIGKFWKPMFYSQ